MGFFVYQGGELVMIFEDKKIINERSYMQYVLE